MRGLQGKVAIITGAGSGIGTGCARRLADEGVKVVVADIDEASARSVVADIEASGGAATAITVDVSVEAEVAHLIDQAIARYGQLDIIHNNAAATGAIGVERDFDIATANQSVWNDTMAVNVNGVVFGCKHALRVMLPRKSGVIINTSSAQSILGDLDRSAYGASKAAVNWITQHVASRYGKRGIRCVGVSPGPIITPAMRTLHSQETLDIYTRHLVLPRSGAPEDIAGAVAFLASDDASFITGQTILVDGGMTCHFPWFAETLSSVDGLVDASRRI